MSDAINNTQRGQLWVAAGTYIPSTDINGQIPTDPKSKTFRLKIDIAIYGGFTGVESNLSARNWRNNPTVLSGNIGLLNDNSDNIRNVVSAENLSLNANTILDGLTISGGYSYNQYNGAGIYVNQTNHVSFVLRNCVIENNYSFSRGCGLYVFNSNPIIENNIFRNNKAFEGGAIYIISCPICFLI